MKTTRILTLVLCLMLPAIAPAETVPCPVIHELCTISGAKGESVSCPLMLVRAHESLKLPGAIEFRISWDAARVKIQPFTYPFCYEGTCYPIDVPQCDGAGCTWGTLATGHSVIAAPADFSKWQGQGVIMAVNFAIQPLTTAYLDQAGQLVGTDGTYLTAKFELLEDIPAASPVSIRMADVVVASLDAFTMPFTVMDLPAGRAFVVDANTPPLAKAGADQTVAANALVTLDGSGSCDPFYDAVSYAWQQIAGPAVTLSDPLAAQPTFQTPAGAGEGNSLVFSLTVQDSGGLAAADTVTIRFVLPGDVDNSAAVDITDGILALQLLAGIAPSATLWPAADLNGDQRLGMEEAIYVLQKVAELR